MPVYLQRIRFTVHTKDQFLAGTNSNVALGVEITKDHACAAHDVGVQVFNLDHPWHDDFQAGKADSYEVVFGEADSGKTQGGAPVPGGLRFANLDEVKTLKLHVEIHGNDRWIFDRYRVGGFFLELRPTGGIGKEMEVVELGWLEMARHNGDVSMSLKGGDDLEAFPIELNGALQP